jgi:hypothetical protein
MYLRNQSRTSARSRRAPMQVARQASGRDAIDLLELARHVRLVRKARRLRNLDQLCPGANQLARSRQTHLSQIALRCEAGDSMKDPDEMALVKMRVAREHVRADGLHVHVVNHLARRSNRSGSVFGSAGRVERAFSQDTLQRGIAAGTVFGRLLAQLTMGEITERDMPLPLTDLKAAKFRSWQSLYYEVGAQAAHFMGARV